MSLPQDTPRDNPGSVPGHDRGSPGGSPRTVPHRPRILTEQSRGSPGTGPSQSRGSPGTVPEPAPGQSIRTSWMPEPVPGSQIPEPGPDAKPPVPDPGIPDPSSLFPDPGARVPDPGSGIRPSRIPDPMPNIPDPGTLFPDPGSRILVPPRPNNARKPEKRAHLKGVLPWPSRVPCKHTAANSWCMGLSNATPKTALPTLSRSGTKIRTLWARPSAYTGRRARPCVTPALLTPGWASGVQGPPNA